MRVTSYVPIITKRCAPILWAKLTKISIKRKVRRGSSMPNPLAMLRVMRPNMIRINMD